MAYPYNMPGIGPYYYQQQMQQQRAQGGVTKVRGPESALQFFVPPNGESEPLFDYNGRQFYIVSADGAGSKTLETFDYWPHVEPAQEPVVVNGVRFESRLEYDKIRAVVAAEMEEMQHGIHGPVQAGADAGDDADAGATAGTAADGSRPKGNLHADARS